MKGSPFKFLDSFTKEDKDIFFGRDKEVEEIYSRVFQSNLLLVYGASGTGKTSLIQCGLANKFNDSDWLPVIIRRGSNILASVRSQLEHLAVTPLKENNTLKKSIQSLYLDHFKPIYLIFDQFEELFIFGTPDEIRSFVTEITKIVHSDLQCKFIFVIRGEYLEHLTAFEEELPEFFNNRIRIEKMTRHNASEAIAGPCRTAGIQVEEGFSSLFLDTLSPDKAEVELTYLQVFLDKLYKSAASKNAAHPVFTNDLLRQIGKISDVLSDFLEEQIARFPDPEMALTVLKSFVSMDGTKKQIDPDEIGKFAMTLGKNIPKQGIELLIHQLVDLRILRDKDESGKYELRHDSLAAKIYEKITLVEKELIEVRSLIETAYSNYQKRQVLINETDLAYIAPYERKLFLNEKLHAFLEESKGAVSRIKRRRTVILLVIASFVFAVLSGFTIWALSERSRAVEQSREAEKQKQLAEQEKNQALLSKDEALQANTLARKEKEKAEHNEKVAVSARQQAEMARQQALVAMGLAEKEKSNALQQSEIARKEERNAEAQREIAKTEKQKAEAAEENANRSFLLSLAQGVALKSPLYKDDPQLQGLLAEQAFLFNQANGGNPREPFIYDALRTALHNLNNGASHSLSASRESKALFERGDTLFYTGRYRVLSMEYIKGAKKNPFFVALNSYVSMADQVFFSADGTHLIAGLLDHKVLFWNLNPGSKMPLPYQELSGHKGLLRAAAFSADGQHFVTGGKDSLLLFWKINGGQVSPEKTIKAGAGIRNLIYAADGIHLYALQEDGKIVIWDSSNSTSQPFAFKGLSRPTTIAYDRSRNTLTVGVMDGSIWLCPANGKQVQIKAHSARVDFIAYSSDFKTFASAGSDRIIKLFNAENTEESPEVIKDLNSKVRCMIFASDGRLIAGCADKNIYLIEPSALKLAAEVSELLKRNLSREEWKTFFRDFSYQKTKPELPEPQ
jgi:WD40 repeat protein/Fe-S cluster biosynthesis and repair protein YggX